MQQINYMDPKEFIDSGYLHEVNRLLLHPLGLALQVTPVADEDGCFQAAIWDYRDNPEGMVLGDDLLSADKATAIAREMFERREARIERTAEGKRAGFVVQPVETDQPTLTTSYINPAEGGRQPVKQGQHFPGIGDVEFEA